MHHTQSTTPTNQLGVLFQESDVSMRKEDGLRPDLCVHFLRMFLCLGRWSSEDQGAASQKRLLSTESTRLQSIGWKLGQLSQIRWGGLG